MHGRTATALAAVALITLTGCGGGAHQKPSRTATAGASARPLTARQLADALLTTHGGWGAITPPSSGAFSSLPTGEVGDVPGAKSGVTFSPARCAGVIWAGPDPAGFGTSPAAVVALRVPGDHSPTGVQVWNELIAVNGRRPRTALGTGPRPGCERVQAESRGRTMTYEELKVPSVGTGTRGGVVDVHVKGSRKTQVVTFTTARYVGVVLAQGPVKPSELNGFVTAFYRHAHQRLG